MLWWREGGEGSRRGVRETVAAGRAGQRRSPDGIHRDSARDGSVPCWRHDLSRGEQQHEQVRQSEGRARRATRTDAGVAQSPRKRSSDAATRCSSCQAASDHHGKARRGGSRGGVGSRWRDETGTCIRRDVDCLCSLRASGQLSYDRPRLPSARQRSKMFL